MMGRKPRYHLKPLGSKRGGRKACKNLLVIKYSQQKDNATERKKHLVSVLASFMST